MSAFFLLAVPLISDADVITFEEGLYTGSESWGPIPSVYSGFSWNSNAYWMTKDHMLDTGYEYGTIGNVSMYNFSRGYISMSTTSTDFNFSGAYITAAYNTSQNVIVEGWKNGSLLYNSTITTSNDQPYWFDFNYKGVDTIWFKVDAGSPTPSTWIAIDNITTTVAPEPISATLFIVGGATLGLRRFRKKFKK
jgi:hypothetical protein